ncbi:MAG: type I secretion system permease/ATPase [Phenylobacterium sp.]|nr:type I secretion system permease/ATPase [Methylocystis sp.]MCA6345611.1 type I secretion system permease/ATPase [Phenylobacterium sp.]MCA6355290.1 type I secretion system permease/ATPase [Phenylobacterium sp.]MCA6358253.1 type I secretion system permease/ATPase [Phenylobacterium sp.]MCA6360068.1 type I secretion system permease/ATPase [Phenylobacterium sp.]
MTPGHDAPADTGLGALMLVLGFHQISADLAQLQHALGKADGAEARDLVSLARRLRARARLARVRASEMSRAPLPLIARDPEGAFFVLAAIRDGEALVQRPWAAPETVGLAALQASWQEEVVLITTREGAIGEGRFDVSWFIPALVRYRGLIGDVLAASFVLQLFALATPLIFQVVIDKVLVHQGLTTLNVLGIALAAIVVFECLLGGLRAYIFTHTTNRVDVELGAKLYRHLLSLPLAYFESRRVGDTVARVRELETIREFLTSSAVTLIIDVFFTVVFLVVMWFYSPWLLLVVLAAIALYVLICVIVTPPLRRLIDERFRRGAESQAFLVESVTGVMTLKAAAVEPQMQTRWERLLSAYVRAGFDAAKLQIWGGQAIQLVSKLSTVLVLFIGARLAISGQLSVGELVAFNMLAARVAEPVLRLAGLWTQFQEARVGVQRLGDILNSPTESTFQPSRSALPTIRGAVTFDDVTFRYAVGGREVLRGVSISADPGEVIGIVGPSGSGKSTLTKLVQRLYVPESGRVLVDGVDLALVDPAWLRRQIGVVLQENLLFNRTVRENIALADPGASMEAVIQAARLAGAHDFILELSQGYDTPIEERGANLSGGQRQRIAIARALITDPRILILDEATSALDAESEAIIQTNMRQIIQGRTVLIIAHRLSAIRIAQRIVTLEAGQITEQGSHESLMAAGGRYSRMWRAQTEGTWA